METSVAESLKNSHIAEEFQIYEDIVKIITENPSGFKREDFTRIVFSLSREGFLNGGADFV
ncbi:MAG: hypothetical protein LBO66_06240 [Deltaproteobacteria bacterium]|nr:hypothetical protein [Deltaproteobacteria bacterium]